jgi:LPXTG-site transpeptidase (sortase) family protein
MANSGKSKKNKGDTERTRTVQVKPREDPHYTLHIMPARAPHEVTHVPKKGKPAIHRRNPVMGAAGKKVEVKIWRTLEWLATSALIFMVLFFALNFSAYFELFKLKLDKLRGQYALSPYIEKILEPPAQSPTQELLPVATTVAQSKKQVPSLSLEITPPDDRIIIPRINKNVPVVQVSAENLLKRDWNGLEKDIQNSLKDGVVHYPGTAQPGEHGNVVITGHSSYFIWDPGRFKDVFALLHEVAIGDDVVVYHNQEKYIYRVYDTQVVMPDKVDILTQEGGDKLTLITCTPVGTNLKRLVVMARPV